MSEIEASPEMAPEKFITGGGGDETEREGSGRRNEK